MNKTISPMWFCFLVLFVGSVSVFASPFVITNTNDSGPGSLRQAILDANGNNEDDTITFDAVAFSTAQTITLLSGQLVIGPDESSGTQKSLTISGPGANILTISGNNQSRVISVESRAKLTISGVKIAAGNGVGGSEYFSAGGAILVKNGALDPEENSLTLKDSIISENETPTSGGGIEAYSTTTIINTAIYGNRAMSGGGGVSGSNGTRLHIINSTISGNNAVIGGGIHSYGSIIDLTNCTVAYNVGTANPGSGNGIFLTDLGIFYVSVLHLKNTIVAKNQFGTSAGASDIYGSIVSDGFNIISNTAGIISTSGNLTGNQLNVDPKIDWTLGLNGGVVPTYALRSDSSAIDHGDNCVLNTAANGGCSDPNITMDQRGVARPQDADGNGTAEVDIGAFEVTRAEILNAPTLDLRPESDSGVSDTDNITRLSNLSFDVGGLTDGATVQLLRDGVIVSTATVAGSMVIMSDPSGTEYGTHIYTSRQIIGSTTSIHGNSVGVVFDNIGPNETVQQAASQVDPTRTQPINFTVTFDEPVVGFDSTDVSLAGSSANVSEANILVSGGGSVFNVQVSNLLSDGTVSATVLANSLQDLAGNSNIASTSTDNTITFDTTPPSVTINQAASQADPTNQSPINFTVIFSEPVTGFTSADISLAGSTASVASATKTVTGSGNTYNVAVGNVSSDGSSVTTSIPALAAQDAAGNTSTASTSADNTVTLDNVRPTVTINQTAGQADPTNAVPINYTVIFSEPVTGFDASDLSFSGSTLSTGASTKTVTGSGTTYNVAIGNLNSNGGVLRVSAFSGAAADALGNTSVASTALDNAVTFDNTPPSVTINQVVGQTDPTNVLPINYRVVFSEPVTGFDAVDLSFSGSSIDVTNATKTITGSGTTYNVAIGNINSNGGTLRVSVASEAVVDSVGNKSLVSTSTDNSVVFDNTRPTVTIDQAAGQADPTVAQPVNFTVVFSEAVTGFAASDISLANSTADVSTANVIVTGSGSIFNVAVSNIKPTGIVNATIIGGATLDGAGNQNLPSTSSDNSVNVNFAIVSGRVSTPDGRGLRNAVVSIIDSHNVVRTVTTSSFGLFTFDNISVGEVYTIRVSSKLYRFSSQVVTVNDDETNLHFVGQE